MKHIFHTIQHTARAATVLLLALLAAQTAGAEDIATYYLDKDGTRYDVNATVLTGTEENLGSTDQATWYVVNSNIQYTDVWLICYGDVNLILADGTTMTANNTIDGEFGSLTIYGQTLGTGTLDATGDISYSGGDIIINGGIVKATSTGGSAISSSENLTINGGTVDAKGMSGLDAGNVTINGGNVTATGGDYGQGINANTKGTITINGGIVDAKGGSGLCATNIAISGGKVTATATATGDYDAGIYTYNGTITLGWTRASDFIQANSYHGTVSVKGSLAFLTDDATPVTISGNNIDPASISGRKLTPDLSSALAQDGDTYTIKNTTGWNLFCDMLEAGETFSGKIVELDGDITVTRMAGGQPFTGTFDGQNHKLTLAYGTADAPVDAQFVAPFIETSADGDHQPTFCNLTIDGTIYATHTQATDHDHVGGLIGHLFGTVTIEDCTSLVEIHAKGGAGGFVGLCEHSVSFTDCHSAAVIASAGGNNSGFVAWSRSSEWNINFTGCLFDGKLLQQNGSGASNGGFIGWKGDAKIVTITNCLCAPAPLADGETMAKDGSATFSREHSDHPATITNCYDTAAFSTAQGKATHTVAAGTDVTIDAIALTGDATEYNVSGITAYSGGGLQLGETLYYGSDDQLSLTLSNTATGAPQGYQYDGYTASAGTLSGTTLTMPDENVTISLGELSVIDWETVNQGTSTDPYMIYNKDQLDLLAYRVNGTHGETRQGNGYSGKYFKLAKDISYPHKADGEEGADAESNYEAIGGYYDGNNRYFRGHFVGNNKTISGIRIHKDDDDDFQGIFGQTYSGADIRNLTLADARITGHNYTGGIVGYNGGGTVTRCHVAADVAVCAVKSYASYHGGIAGYNFGTIEQCTSAATLTIAAAANSMYYGGIAGFNGHILLDNLAIGATVPAAGGNTYGAITGAITGANYYTLQCNYYAACKVADTENATGVGCGYIGNDDDGYTTADVTANNGAVPALRDNADNSTALGLLDRLATAGQNGNPLDLGWGAGKYPMQLSGRTLYKDGAWNTLCLPFALTAAQIADNADFAGAKLMTLDTEQKNGFDTTGGTMYLSFKEATAIEAGVPYLVKWDKAEGYDANPSKYDIANPVFEGVTISGTEAQTTEVATDGMEAVQMVGTYSPVSVTAGDQSIMFLGTQNTLYYTTKGRDILSCRAYFAVPYIKGNAAAKVSAFTLNFNDEVTGITTTNFTNFANEAGAWYTLDGRKLSGKPTKKGMYINNGKKIVIE